MSTKNQKPKGPGLFSILKPYRGMVTSLVLLTIASSAIGLLIPRIIAHGIDAFIGHKFDIHTVVWQFLAASLGIFVLSFGISVVQTFTAERVARDLRTQLANRISRQEYGFLQKTTPAQLLTNLTADVDSIKIFISQAVATILDRKSVV